MDHWLKTKILSIRKQLTVLMKKGIFVGWRQWHQTILDQLSARRAHTRSVWWHGAKRNRAPVSRSRNWQDGVL